MKLFKISWQKRGTVLTNIVTVILGVVLLSCTPSAPSVESTTTTSAATTTTVGTTTTRPTTSTTTTTTQPASDESSALATYIRNSPNPVIDRTWNVGVVDITGLSNKTIQFTSTGILRRNYTPSQNTAPVLNLNGSNNVTINNVKIQGASVCMVYSNLSSFGVDATIVQYNPATEHQAGIQLVDAKNITLNGGYVQNVEGDGVYMAGTSSNITLTNMLLSCNGRGNVTNVGADHVLVQNGTYAKAGYWNFNIEPDLSADVIDYRIVSPTVGFSNDRWLFSGGPYYSCKVSQVRVTNPVIMPRLWGWYVKPCTPPVDLVVTGCIDNSTPAGPPNPTRPDPCKQG